MATEFRLQQVLDYHRQREEQQQRVLTSLIRRLREAEEGVQRLRDEAAEARRQLQSERGRRLDPRDIEQARAYLGWVEGAIAQRRLAEEEAQRQVADGRQQLATVLREKQMLERLEQRSRAEAAVVERRAGERELDELNNARFAREIREAS